MVMMIVVVVEENLDDVCEYVGENLIQNVCVEEVVVDKGYYSKVVFLVLCMEGFWMYIFEFWCGWQYWDGQEVECDVVYGNWCWI